MSGTAKPVITVLDPAQHDRSCFACGVEALDRYLRVQAGQDARRLTFCWSHRRLR